MDYLDVIQFVPISTLKYYYNSFVLKKYEFL